MIGTFGLKVGRVIHQPKCDHLEGTTSHFHSKMKHGITPRFSISVLLAKILVRIDSQPELAPTTVAVALDENRSSKVGQGAAFKRKFVGFHEKRLGSVSEISR